MSLTALSSGEVTAQRRVRIVDCGRNRVPAHARFEFKSKFKFKSEFKFKFEFKFMKRV